MSTLSKDAHWFKKFMNGDHGWSHSAQEFGVYASTLSMAGWLCSPVLALLLLLLYVFGTKYPKGLSIPFVGDKYWVQREIDQSNNMVKQGRRAAATEKDLKGVPSTITPFWTQDAIEDTKFPKRMRVFWFILSLGYIFYMYNVIGLLGVIV